jgi:hypothetical protein
MISISPKINGHSSFETPLYVHDHISPSFIVCRHEGSITSTVVTMRLYERGLAQFSKCTAFSTNTAVRMVR